MKKLLLTLALLVATTCTWAQVNITSGTTTLIEGQQLTSTPTIDTGYNYGVGMGTDGLFHCWLPSGSFCDPSGSGSSLWSGLGNPTGNLSLTMGADTSLFTFNAATGSSDLFKLTDTASNTGTGVMLHVTTASSSTELPVQLDANGNGLKMDTTGLLKKVGTGALDSASLNNNSVTVNTSSPLSGGGSVALGNSLSLSISAATTSAQGTVQLGPNAASSTLANVATSGSYNDLSNTPALATVATSGKYSDLVDVSLNKTCSSTFAGNSCSITGTASTNLATTTIATPTNAGMYRVCFYAYVSSGSGSGSVASHIGYNNGASKNPAVGAGFAPAANADNNGGGAANCISFYNVASGAITVGTANGTGTYTLTYYASLERLM